MSGQNKIYVIDPVGSKAGANIISSSGENGKELGENGKELPKYLQSSGDGRNGSQGTSRARTNDRQSGVPLILSYLAGPLSILTTRRGRRSRFWAGIAVFSVLLFISVIWMWREFPYWSTRETPAGAVILLAAALAVVSGFSAWTKAVILAGRYEGPRLRRSPGWIRGPLAAGLFGIICPGMGLFVTGRTKHAAAVLWMTCLTVLALLFLSRAEWLWNFNAYAGAFSVRPGTLEYLFIGISAATVLGGLAWIVQALNGARLARRSSSRKTVSQRNWSAVALLVSIIAFSALSRPAVIAEALDKRAVAVSHKGMKIIPLHLFLAASRLDPSRPDYVIKAIELYEEIGDQVMADVMRRDLINRLESSVPLLEEEGIVVSKIETPPEDMIFPAAIDAQTVAGPGIKTIPAELLILDWERSQAIP
ncbi:MAG: hypothetical protein JXB45_13005 [Candidatus Krumholzibacteriota bacterium]|nr:hypothetical protein [Candidatus Krumholzibacteriota bacterium]